jgi:hypothetical protein
MARLRSHASLVQLNWSLRVDKKCHELISAPAMLGLNKEPLMPGPLLISIAVVLTVLCCSDRKLLIRAGPNDNPQQDLLNLEQKWLDSEDDPSSLEWILADDFIHVLPGGICNQETATRILTQAGNGRR